MDDWNQVRPHLETARRFALDLEGDFNLYHYGRRICLVQIALEDGRIFLLDPLLSNTSIPDWPGWKEILENPAIEKVIWAAQNDVRALKYCWGMALRGLFDLFDAARFLGIPHPSLPYLSQTFLDISIQKAEETQTSNWNERPLSQLQRDYAAQDVQFLLAIARQMKPQLVAKEKIDLFQMRMRAVEALEFTDYAEPWLKMKGLGSFTPEQLLLAKDLWCWREKRAQEWGIAAWRLATNEHLLAWLRT